MAKMRRVKGKDGKYYKVPDNRKGRSTRSSGKRSYSGRRGGGRYVSARSYVTKHKTSLAVLLAVGGVAALTTAIGADAVGQIVAFIGGVAARLGYKGTVDNTTIVAAYLFVCGAAVASPWVGRKVNAFLGRFNLKL